MSASAISVKISIACKCLARQWVGTHPLTTLGDKATTRVFKVGPRLLSVVFVIKDSSYRVGCVYFDYPVVWASSPTPLDATPAPTLPLASASVGRYIQWYYRVRTSISSILFWFFAHIRECLALNPPPRSLTPPPPLPTDDRLANKSIRVRGTAEADGGEETF